MKLVKLILILFLFVDTLHAQKPYLKSYHHAFRISSEDVHKDSIIREIRFQDGKDDTVSVARIDNVGKLTHPLIISSKQTVPTDSLGHLSFILNGELFENFLWLIDNYTQKKHTRKFDSILLRVTYRYHGKTNQYYVTNKIFTSSYLLMIDEELRNSVDANVLKTFHKFVYHTGLIKFVRGKVVWTELQ